ncbi:MAG: hypothetical protein HZB25_06675 [Candidatus Eisenbacteria bacterium]|nr:hypothetical protein [Candidatus Eisenbacteria bacterium]
MRPARTLAAAALLLAAAACFPGCSRVSHPVAPCGCPGTANFAGYVAVGNSLTAGYQSGGLVDAHQDAAYPVLLARQFGLTRFPHPRVSAPGFPALLFMDWDHPAGGLPFSVHPHAGLGTLENPEEAPYSNLGVPGARVAHFFVNDTTPMFPLLLGGRGTMWEQLKASRPGFVTFWLGNNDALEALLQGTPAALTPLDQFRASYTAAVDSILSTGAKLAVGNIPDILDTPYATTVPPYAFDAVSGRPILVFGQRIPFIGQRDGGAPGPLDPRSLVTLEALQYLLRGDGIPTFAGGTGKPLPDHTVLTPLEVDAILTRTRMFNQAINEVCGVRHIPIMDANALYRRIRVEGYSLGGVTYTSQYVQGGIMSLDGVHPGDLGQAIIANEFVAVINTAYGSALRPVNLAPFLHAAPQVNATAGSPLAGLAHATQGIDWGRVRRYGF